MQAIKFIDLFAGIGGFHYGILGVDKITTAKISGKIDNKQGNNPYNFIYPTQERRQSDFTCVYSNEWDKYASSVYKKHYGECDTTDITRVRAEDIPDHDLLVGGFPCQAFSLAGKRGGFNDTRGTLFFDVARILKAKRPRYFILENVKGLLSHENGETIKTIFRVLTDFGYDFQWHVFNSRTEGVPQNRERIYIVGHLRGQPRPEILFTSREISTNTSTSTNDEQKAERIIRTRQLGQNGKLTSPIANALQASEIPHVIDNSYPKRTRVYEKYTPTIRDYGSGGNKMPMVVDHGRAKITEIVNTVDANYYKGLDNHGQRTAIKEGLSIRRLTPIECERLQGFPDDYTKYGADGELISDTQRYKMLGNAVTTNVVTIVAEAVYKAILKSY